VNALSQRSHFTNARATNFYYSFVFLPREKRRAIEAVYAFARRGDDAVDAGLSREEAAKQVEHCREDLDFCYGGRGSDGRSRAELRALAEAVERFKIPRSYFDDLILGLEMDLNGTGYATFEDLSLYCYRVASTIGLISIEIFGYQNPRTRDYAVNLGMALQCVNIVRDLGSDARRGRVYIPAADLDRFQVPRQALLEGRPSGRYAELVEFEAARARSYFERARQALAPEDRRAMLAAEIMAAIYWRLLRRIERRKFEVFSKRVRLSRPLKFWTALSVYLGAEWFR
jgi:15-cis-phytoene synthase